jgi:hypothetical protein
MMLPFAIIFSILFVAGLALLVYVARSLYFSIAAARWPIAEGTITNCSQEFYVSGRSNNQYIRVVYSYSVNGRPFQGNRLAFGYAGNNFTDEDDCMLEMLRNAKYMEVRYNPEKPAVSTLSFGFHRSLRFMIGFVAIWFSFIIGFSNGWLQGPFIVAFFAALTFCIGVAVLLRANFHDDETLSHNLVTRTGSTAA